MSTPTPSILLTHRSTGQVLRFPIANAKQARINFYQDSAIVDDIINVPRLVRESLHVIAERVKTAEIENRTTTDPDAEIKALIKSLIGQRNALSEVIRLLDVSLSAKANLEEALAILHQTSAAAEATFKK